MSSITEIAFQKEVEEATPMPSNSENLQLRSLLLAIERERKNHTARMLLFEQKIRALLGYQENERSPKRRQVKLEDGRKRVVEFEAL